MKKHRQLLIGVVIGALVFGGIPALADMVNLDFNSINITVNGNKVNADNILYNDTTYVPLRAISEMLNKDVGWDGDTNTASINDKAEATPPAASGTYSRSNPAPIGTAQTYKYDGNILVGGYTCTIRVTETIRGDKALEMINAVNTYLNYKPEDGYEYIVAKIAFSVLTVDNDNSVLVNPLTFECFTSNDESYKSVFVSTPKPELGGSLYAGGNTEGYIVFQVKKDDPSPKIAYGRNPFNGSGGIWFALQ